MSPRALQHNDVWVPLADGWEDGSQVVALGPRDGGFRPNLVVSAEEIPFGESAKAMVARQLEELRARLPSYELLGESDVSFGPNRGVLRDHAFTMDGTDIRQFQFSVIVGATVYTLTFTHLKERFPQVRPLAERLFAEARLVPDLELEPADGR